MNTRSLYFGGSAIIALAAALMLLCGCNVKSVPISETRLLLDTVCTVTVYGEEETVLTAALDLCAEYEARLSRTVPDSDVWRINNARGEPVTVDTQTARLVEYALNFGEISDGAFDITVGQLCALWDFGGRQTVPSKPDLDAALACVDYTQVAVRGDTVLAGGAETCLDLGGIAKGFIADEMAAFLIERGVQGAVIDLGGNIVVIGEKPGGGLWNIGITRPFADRSELIGAVSIAEGSVVTSGVYERGFTRDGVFYHHILDPKTGMPAVSDVISATVVTKNSAAGDALSTIAVLVGSEKAQAVLTSVPEFIGAVLILENGDFIQFGDITFAAS